MPQSSSPSRFAVILAFGLVLHRIHLAAGARSHLKSIHLRLCESRGRGFSRMAYSPRARGPLHWDGQYRRGARRNPGNQRESERDHRRREITSN